MFSPNTALLVAFFFSCLTLSHPQDVQCLQCNLVPAQCNFSLIEEPARTGEKNLNGTCVPDTEACINTICDHETVCAYGYFLGREPGGGNATTPAIMMQSTAPSLTFFSGCFSIWDCSNKCVTDMDLTIELHISCCCNKTGASCSDAVRSVAEVSLSLTSEP